MRRSSRVIAFIMVAAVIAATWCMVGQYGMIPGLDFGCGQYYYTDIPNWQKYFSVRGVVDSVPRWVYYVLFFAWGWAMYRLWGWLERRNCGKIASSDLMKEGVYEHQETVVGK